MRLTQYRIEGLGHLSTLVADEASGVAAVVDPRRDVDIYLADAARRRAADHRRRRDASPQRLRVGRPRARGADRRDAPHRRRGGAPSRARARRDGDAFDVGSIRFRTLDTPGHTPEHVSFAVADTARADEPFLLFTGGSLLVGAVGRTDLLGAEHARPYAAAMHRSLHDVLLRHEDSVMVYPTHGAGSLCSTGIASTSWSTIGYERRHDPLLAPMEVDAFARALLAGQPTFPRYFARMRPINQAGPPLLGGVVPTIPPLSGDALDAALAGGALVVDARSPEAHARDRVPGSLSIPAGSSFGTWLGWVVDADRPVVLVVDDVADLEDLSRQALRIGFESVLGHVDGGFEAWRRAGRPVEAGSELRIDRLAATLSAGGPDAPFLIDVRQRAEYEAGTSRAHAISGPPTCQTCWTGSLAIGRSRRSAPAATARASLRRCCVPPASSVSRRCPTGFLAGRSTASRWSTGPGATTPSGPPGPAGPANPAHPPNPARRTLTSTLSARLSRPGSRSPRVRPRPAARHRAGRRVRSPTRPARCRSDGCGARPSGAGR